jgi:Methyltransferase domain
MPMSPLLRVPILRPILLYGYRFWLGLQALGAYSSKVLRWWIGSKETTNFTYPLEALSEQYLYHFLSHHTGVSKDVVVGYVDELKNDVAFREHIYRGIWQSGEAYKADLTIHFGKRMGWYALVRILKPKVIIETGVDKGLGSVVLCAALARNAADGAPGYYYGTDINPKAGYLLKDQYAQYGKILYGDSIESLAAFGDKIDLFINDSDHSATYEADEYRVVADKLASNALIVGDNCEVTNALCDFAEKSGRTFAFWREEPQKHWFSGGGIGLAYKK